MKLGFIGYGSLGRQIETMMREDGWTHPSETVYFDDKASADKLPKAVHFNAWQEEQYSEFTFILALGYRQLHSKGRLVEQMLQENRKLLTLIHSSAIVSPSAFLKEGVIVFSGCVLDQNVKIGEGTIIYNGTIIAHDSYVGKAAFLAPGVTVSGNVSVGDRVFIGAGSCIANAVKIGNDCLVGMGSVVSHDLSDECCAVGNPIRVLKKKLNLK